MQRHAKDILVYRHDTLQNNVYLHGVFPFTIYQHGFRTHARMRRNVMHIDVSSAQGM